MGFVLTRFSIKCVFRILYDFICFLSDRRACSLPLNLLYFLASDTYNFYHRACFFFFLFELQFIFFNYIFVLNFRIIERKRETEKVIVVDQVAHTRKTRRTRRRKQKNEMSIICLTYHTLRFLNQ